MRSWLHSDKRAARIKHRRRIAAETAYLAKQESEADARQQQQYAAEVARRRALVEAWQRKPPTNEDSEQ